MARALGRSLRPEPPEYATAGLRAAFSADDRGNPVAAAAAAAVERRATAREAAADPARCLAAAAREAAALLSTRPFRLEDACHSAGEPLCSLTFFTDPRKE
jgi:hypothetical protein